VGVPRVLRTQLSDGFFHVHTLGVADTPIYRDDEDRRSWLQIFRASVRRYRWEIWAVSLMTTHYHVVLHSTCERLSNGMQWLNGRYAQDFNRRHGRKGHLFADRFRSWVIEDEEYLAAACRYAVFNPVRAGLCGDPAEWPWNASRYGLRDL
jgi:putative transposase